MINVLLFARLREIVGQESIELHCAEVCTVRDSWNVLRIRFPDTAGFEKTLLFAVNKEFADLETKIKEGDELAIFPPVAVARAPSWEKIYQEDERRCLPNC
jgi:molybdopterin synthase sulfur carrier subunit